MKYIDIFYQSEDFAEPRHLEYDCDATISKLRQHLCEKHALDTSMLLYLEDADDPLLDSDPIKDCCTGDILKIHLHRCRHIQVHVTYNGEAVSRKFRPGATVARVKRWAAERKFSMSEDVAGEHMLQISGTHDRPSPGTHIGSLTGCGECEVSFDLVPDERVNGYADHSNDKP